MRRAVVALLVIVAFVACGRQRNEAQPRERVTGDNRARMNPIMPPNSDLPGKRTPGAAAAQTRIDLEEYDIRMADTLPAGPQSFFVANGGKMQHSLAIEGNGVSAALPQPLTRGDTATLSVDLKPGTYTFYCPVDSHKGRGMSRTVTVR